MTVTITFIGGEDYTPTGNDLIEGDTLVLVGTGGDVNLSGINTEGAITVQLQGTVTGFVTNGVSTAIAGAGASVSSNLYFLKIGH